MTPETTEPAAIHEIYAIIQINKINATKEALARIGIYSLHVFPALGHGKGLVDEEILAAAARGEEEALAVLDDLPRLVPKRSFSVIVPADRSPEVVDAIMDANHTGHHGDGKIFVVPIENAVRIRTAESGLTALN
jgi:nitrogen regulatory protein PII 2